MQFGPSSVFSNKNDKRESASVTRTSSSSNMFAALNSNEATPDAASVGSRTANSTRPPSRKASVDFSVGSVADGRRKLLLQPRTQVVASDAGSFRDDTGSAIGQSEQGDDDAASATASATQGMSAEQAKRKIKEDVKELFMLRQSSEAEGYFSSLPLEFRWQLVGELVSKAIDAKPADAQLVSDVFSVAASKSLVDEAQFSQGFTKDMEYLHDTSTDSPSAYGNMAILLKGANLSQAAVERYARCPLF
jgi:translation initiation factor 4G